MGVQIDFESKVKYIVLVIKILDQLLNMDSRTDFIEVNLILQEHLSYYIPFFNQSFPGSLWSVLAFPNNSARKAKLCSKHIAFLLLRRLSK